MNLIFQNISTKKVLCSVTEHARPQEVRLLNQASLLLLYLYLFLGTCFSPEYSLAPSSEGKMERLRSKSPQMTRNKRQTSIEDPPKQKKMLKDKYRWCGEVEIEREVGWDNWWVY